jgi:hypothetical protein
MAEEDIQFANVARPQVRLIVGVCKRCGNPIVNVGTICFHCMNKNFFTEAIRQQVEAFKKHPDVQLVIARDERKREHTILIGHPVWSYCGIRPTEPLKKRRTVSPGKLPLDLCAKCRRLVEWALERSD